MRSSAATKNTSGDLQEFYAELAQELEALMADGPTPVANAANAAALIYQRLPRVNWVGFYFLAGDQLLLGPFQGTPACTRIKVGQGVCGTAVARRRSILVPDVHAFPGHIACDAASRSELVVPLWRGAAIVGVLDLDSPDRGRFGIDDQAGCEQLAAIAARCCEPTALGYLDRI